MVRLFGVQVVPVAALGRQRSGGLWLGRAGRCGATAEAPLGGVGDGESEGGDSDGLGDAHGEFQQRDFSEAYERYHTERLQGRSKQELVQDYLDLERRLSQAEEETRRLQQLQRCTSQQSCHQVEELAAEVERLRTENQRLRQENEMWNREGSSGGGEPGT